MTETTNYSLKKPASSDYYNVENFNDNMDAIDTGLKTVSDAADAAQATANTAVTNAATAQTIADTAVANAATAQATADAAALNTQNAAQLGGVDASKFSTLDTSGRTSIPAGANLNEYMTTGRFFIANSAVAAQITNAPTTLSGGYIDVNIESGSGAQRFYGWGNWYMQRYWNGSSWASWDGVAWSSTLNSSINNLTSLISTAQNTANAALPKSGGTMTGNIVMTASGGYTGAPLTLSGGDSAGALVKIQGGAAMVIGAGEAPGSLINAESIPSTSEVLHLCSDSTITLWTNCNVIANRTKITISTAGALSVPANTDYTTYKARPRNK